MKKISAKWVTKSTQGKFSKVRKTVKNIKIFEMRN